jgi:hypothetical protein
MRNAWLQNNRRQEVNSAFIILHFAFPKPLTRFATQTTLSLWERVLTFSS